MRLSTLLTAALLTAATTASAQTFTDPSSYNNYIVAEQRALLKKNLRYISKSAHSDNEKKIEARRLEVVSQIEASLAKLAKMPAYQGDKEFREKAVDAFYQTLKVYSDDYRKVDVLAATRTTTVENMEQYFAAMEAAEHKLQVVSDSVNAAQMRFAKHHKFSFSQSPEDKKLEQVIEQISEVNTYQHQVFLAQFRIEKSSAKMVDAISAQDAAAFGTSLAKLREDATTAQAALTAIPAFRGKDARYRDAAKNLVTFYAGMCADQFPKMQALLERKDQLTKADAAQFNNLINYYNTNNQKLVQAYNQASSNFMAAYIPVMND